MKRYPLATVMVHLADQAEHPAQVYVCYWSAFTHITTTLAVQSGLRPNFSLRKNGTLRTRKVGDLKIAEITPPAESSRFNRAFRQFSNDLKHKLITHPNTRYFIYRTPTWGGTTIKKDAYGQRPNGVINVALTMDPRYPIWTPIDVALYKEIMADNAPEGSTDTLARQLLDLLSTVRQNLNYGGLRTDSESSDDVLTHATPLLALIVTHFLNPG